MIAAQQINNLSFYIFRRKFNFYIHENAITAAFSMEKWHNNIYYALILTKFNNKCGNIAKANKHKVEVTSFKNTATRKQQQTKQYRLTTAL